MPHPATPLRDLKAGWSSRQEGRQSVAADLRPWFVVSYRRAGAGSVVSLLADKLEAAFPGRVFFDLRSIEAGTDFRSTLSKVIAEANALIVVIHPTWAIDRDDRGSIRLTNEDDVVRQEVRSALNAGILVLPILIEGARMPPHDALPADISALSSKSALHLHLDTATDREINEIVLTLVRTRPLSRVLSLIGWQAALLLLPTAGLLYPYWRWTHDAHLLTLWEFVERVGLGWLLIWWLLPLVSSTVADYARRRVIDSNSPVRGILGSADRTIHHARLLALWTVVVVTFIGVRLLKPAAIVVDLVQGPFDADPAVWVLTHHRDTPLEPQPSHIVVTLNLGRERPRGVYKLSLLTPTTEQYLLNRVWSESALGYTGVQMTMDRVAEFPRAGFADPRRLDGLPPQGRFVAEVGSSTADSSKVAFHVTLAIQRSGESPEEVRRVCVNIPLDLPDHEKLPPGGAIRMHRLDAPAVCYGE